MKRRSKYSAAFALTLVVLFGGACSVELTQTVLPSTPPPAATAVGSVELPEYGLPFSTVDAPETDIQVSDGLANMGLSGNMIFLTLTQENQLVMTLDLATGLVRPIFSSPPNSWVLSASIGANPDEILLAYAPPPAEDQPQYGYSDLFILTPNSPEPSVLLARSEDFEAYFGSIFAPDGNSVLYTHFVSDDSVDFGFRYHVTQLPYPEGQPVALVEDAFWQRLSTDGRQMAYVTFDPQGQLDDELHVIDLASGEERRVVDPEVFPTVDAPFFGPNDSHVYFSAVDDSQESLSWLDQLTGVRLAKAHDVPSDWWRVDLISLSVSRVTEILDRGMYGNLSPDGTQISFISSRGLFIMNPDGSNLVQVLESTSLFGSLEWIP